MTECDHFSAQGVVKTVDTVDVQKCFLFAVVLEGMYSLKKVSRAFGSVRKYLSKMLSFITLSGDCAFDRRCPVVMY